MEKVRKEEEAPERETASKKQGRETDIQDGRG